MKSTAYEKVKEFGLRWFPQLSEMTSSPTQVSLNSRNVYILYYIILVMINVVMVNVMVM